MAEESEKSSVSIVPQNVQVKATIDNFYRLITNHYGKTIRMNEMTGKPEWYDKSRKIWREWTDAQESQARAYFESNYGMYSQAKLADALAIYFADNKVNPLLNILDKLEWDGKPRIEHFLHDVMKADDSEYIRECSRLIFAGGIHRAYEPGCKFDDMIVLIGGQSAGKSTIVRWLNMEDEFFREIKTINGKEGIEAIRGVWIGEVAELMAMTRVKEAEAVKAYITSQEDSYRPPYGKQRKCWIKSGKLRSQQWKMTGGSVRLNNTWRTTKRIRAQQSAWWSFGTGRWVKTKRVNLPERTPSKSPRL